MNTLDPLTKLNILTAGAKQDVGCPQVCLLKVLMTNVCIYDCAYCVNRRSNDIRRTTFSPTEVAELTMKFYRRKLITGLFLSSGIIKSPDYTTELMIKALHTLRVVHGFPGYIHAKVMPGADSRLLTQLGQLSDRISINIELPTEKSLSYIAPDKSKGAIFGPMSHVYDAIDESEFSKKRFAPAGQCTQLIVGATPENDRTIINLAQGLYRKYGLRRVFYSAYEPVIGNDYNRLPTADAPLLRQHRIYQADWLLRFYGFTAEELFSAGRENLSLKYDPKFRWAVENMHIFPVEINRAELFEILRVPGIGIQSAKRIISARKLAPVGFDDLKKMGAVLNRAKYFITCADRIYGREVLNLPRLEHFAEWEQVMLN